MVRVISPSFGTYVSFGGDNALYLKYSVFMSKTRGEDLATDTFMCSHKWSYCPNWSPLYLCVFYN